MIPNGKINSDVDSKSRRLFNSSDKMETSTIQDKRKEPFKRKIVWKNVIVFFIGHLAAIYGFYLWLFDITWSHFVVSFLITYFAGVQGILMGAHRYYTHRCFKASKAIQIAMLICQTACSQNCMWVWVRDHRQHHKYSDTDADPHNAKNGFFFSHVGWLLSRKHPEVIEKGKTVDMSDLDADPLVTFQKRYYFSLWFLTAILIPVSIPIYVFGESLWRAFLIWIALRVVVTLNITWSVNSWAHLYGSKPFDKNIMPRESYFVSFFAGGEGWHNYHHTFPWDYKASELGAPLNATTRYINMCARLGLVWDLKAASDKTVVARALRTGDGTPIFTKPHLHLNVNDS